MTSVERLEALAHAWAGLLPPGTPPTLHPRWVLAAVRTLHRTDEVLATVVFDGTSPIALAPLVRRPGRRLHLEVAGARSLHEPTGLPHRDAEALGTLVDALVAAGHPVHLGRLREHGPELDRLDGLSSRRAFVARQEVRGTPWVDCRGGPDALEGRLSSDRRSSLRRNARRATEAGGVEFDVTAPTEDEVRRAYAEFVAVEHRSWKGTEGTSLRADRRRYDFYSAYVSAAAAAGELRVSRLAIGGQAAAIQLAVERDRRLWVLKLGYDEAWSRCGPGMLLTRETLRWSAARELEAYELLGHEAPWTRSWTERARPYRTVRLYPVSIRAVGPLAGDALQGARRRLAVGSSR